MDLLRAAAACGHGRRSPPVGPKFFIFAALRENMTDPVTLHDIFSFFIRYGNALSRAWEWDMSDGTRWWLQAWANGMCV